MFEKMNVNTWAIITTIFVFAAVFVGYFIAKEGDTRPDIDTNTFEAFDINDDGRLDISDWSAFGTKLQEQPQYKD